LQALLQANTEKETELSVQENEMAMKVSQLQSELEVRPPLPQFVLILFLSFLFLSFRFTLMCDANNHDQICRGQITQLQSENTRLKKNVSEVTAQSMAVNSRHLDSATKLRESIAQLTEKADKAAKDLESAETQLAELRKAKVALEHANAELTEKLSATEKTKQVNTELDSQFKKVTSLTPSCYLSSLFFASIEMMAKRSHSEILKVVLTNYILTFFYS
jgi:hypothetical protein